MLHRALYGSLERFLGLLLDRHGPALPPWLAPRQVALLPVSPAELPAAEGVLARLKAGGLRAELDQEDSLARRIARAHARSAPFQVVVGAREAAAGTAAVRTREGQSVLPVAEAVGGAGRSLRRSGGGDGLTGVADGSEPVREAGIIRPAWTSA